jgi:uncharacterized protein
MLPKGVLAQIIESQESRLNQMEPGLARVVPGVARLTSHALIVSGIRRCGKSTLLRQIRSSLGMPAIFLNFEDPRLTGFDAGDFERLHEICTSREIRAIFFDEIQHVEKWELYIRFAIDEGFRIFLTGSNSSMLSLELGTRLTGRHISRELFPFSYHEYLAFTGREAGAETSAKYMQEGGFPEMIKTGMPEVLMHVFSDIVIRDIAVRHNVRNIAALQQLAVWLITNTGKPVTGNSLRKMFSIGSSSSIMEYLAAFSDAYLFYFVPKFNYSLKVQLVNARKVYCVDTGLIEANSVSFSHDHGRLLENLVYLQLRRTTKEIYYYAEKKECDFIVGDKGKIRSCYQVCYQLDQQNLERELAGLTEAMNFFKLNEGTIITFDQSDSFTSANKTIRAIPFYQWAAMARMNDD